ncbi:hypothetical protein HNR53_002475 [Bacillus benzoevorans]|uniref:Uncharacterized protein n=1 Tax=Bacillus benzoevorans TaxID=1456 RepID=A0A7X0LVB9_9BACI|nr:hypothetical protein [Bacillus benzoevorans]
MKMARCIIELERIYGIRNGGDRGNQYKEPDSHNVNLPKTQKDFATEFSLNFNHLQTLIYQRIRHIL